MSTLTFDPSRPCQITEDLLALWLPRGRGRDARASGLVASVDVCGNPTCRCTTASLQALPIDDRAHAVERADLRMRVTWSAGASARPQADGFIRVDLDFVNGCVFAPGGGALPEAVAPFFAEPLPYWVLDHLWERWCSLRHLPETEWRAQMRDHWEPGFLLSNLIVFPDQRPDHYLVDGTEYRVDTLFCVEPRCPCTEARFSVLRSSEDRLTLDEEASALLPLETMVPREYEGDRRTRERLAKVYLEWRRRHVPAQERLLELREQTRERGLELHRMLAASKPSTARGALPQPSRPVRAAPAPGRNDPCPCGSGKKFKKCCGQ
jgi:hypothetical protein